ncbi:MAG TPA: Ig-like domain-containing protein, partial [Gemmatimonadaceae bacterium]
IIRAATVVVGGVRVLSSRDTIVTAINDTGRAIASAVVRVGGALVSRPSQGIKWTHLGDRATIVGTGDTIRYVSRTNGVDTLIATHDFCLTGAKCADTVFVRVAQQLSLGLSVRSFQSWTFYDSLAPTIVLSDRRGNGQPNTFVRFVPRTALDSTLIKVVPGPFGTTNPTTGQMATPRAQTAGNGLAKVIVEGVSSTGIVLATDSFTVAIRQVARRVAAEPQRAIMSSVDVLPIKGIARDARGAPITDGTITLAPTGIPFDGLYVGPATPVAAQAMTVPTLAGSSLPGANPGAPQLPVAVDTSLITILAPDSIKAGATGVIVATQVLDSLGQPAVGQVINFRSVVGTVVASAQVDASGTVSVLWTPPNTAGNYSLTGVRAGGSLSTVGDSAGRIVIRRSILVHADTATTAQSTLSVNATTVVQSATLTVTVTLRDQFGNPAKSNPPNFVLSAGGVGGTFSAPTCTAGVCTATYTAPGTAGAASISAKIGVADIALSPIAITVTP